MASAFERRFLELAKEADAIEASKRFQRLEGYSIEGEVVDPHVLLKWLVNVRHLLAAACGVDSQHLRSLTEAEQATSSYETSHELFRRLHAVFLAAKGDFEGGYLYTIKELVQADIFATELEQAEELLSSGYHLAAAVVAGVVLETGLREKCTANQLPVGKLDQMNSDLAKAGVHNKLVQKQITALAAIRNSAAHGKPAEFSKADVENMIRDIPKVLA